MEYATPRWQYFVTQIVVMIKVQEEEKMTMRVITGKGTAKTGSIHMTPSPMAQWDKGCYPCASWYKPAEY